MNETKGKDFDPKTELVEKRFSKGFLRSSSRMKPFSITWDPGLGIWISIDKTASSNAGRTSRGIP